MSAVVFDLGGTYLRSGVVKPNGRLYRVEKHKIESFLHNANTTRIWATLIERIATFASQSARDLPAAPIILSFPGPVGRGGRILDAPTVAGSDRSIPPLGSILTQRTARKVHLLNDVAAAAWYISTKTPMNRFMVVTVSSGIGAKIVDRTHPHQVIDTPPYAGEIGHIVVDHARSAPRCDCGALGHLGAISSGRGIERAARRLARSDPRFLKSAAATKFGAMADTLTLEEHLVPAAKLGDRWACAVIRAQTQPLARVLSSSVLAAGLEGVVVIGGLVNALGAVYLDLLREEMAGACDYSLLRGRLKNTVFVADVEEPCLYGCATYSRLLPTCSS